MALRTVHGLVAVLLALFMLAASGPAWAGSPTEQLRTQMDRVIKVLEDGQHWNARTPAEREEFVEHRVAGDRWLTYDVAIEGVSMVANYRAQFNKIIQSSGYPSLVSKLTEKQEQGLESAREPTIRKASQTK
jgi:ABC-type transporter MlaC component